MRYHHRHQSNIRMTGSIPTRRLSSFLLAISFAFSSLDMPAVDFGTGSASAGRGGGDDMGVGRELETGEMAVGLPGIPLNLRAWLIWGWGVSAREGGRGEPHKVDVGMFDGLASVYIVPHSFSTRQISQRALPHEPMNRRTLWRTWTRSTKSKVGRCRHCNGRRTLERT